MRSNKEKFARFGIATKGFVYFLIGTLTAMAAFNLGGEKSDSGNALDFIAEQTFGKILLAITAVGLVGYIFWKWYLAFINPNNLKNNLRNIGIRIGQFGSGLFYALLAFSALKKIIGTSTSSGLNPFISKISGSSYATYVAIAIGLTLLGMAIGDFYRAFSGKFSQEVNSSKLDSKQKNSILNAGKIGLSSRGIVFAVTAFLMFKTAFNHYAIEMNDKTDAFKYLEKEFGALTLGVVSIGFIAYGSFMLLKSKYSSLNVG